MSALLSFLLLAVAAVKVGQTPLRTGCSADSTQVATLPAGVPLTIRYSVSGESQPCYKVVAEVEGKAVEGFLPAGAIAGLEDFDKARREAVWLDTATVMSAIRSSAALPSLGAQARGSGGIAQQAAELIDSSRPKKALDLLERELKIRRDPTLLALAGAAAWRTDDVPGALEYWRASLDLAPNPDLDKLYRQVEREAKGDQSKDRLFGLRVMLRYEASAVSADTARQMTAVLDDEFTRISQELGCTADERVIAIVQSREAYRKSTDAAEWSGGQFDGRIRVPVFDARGLDGNLRRALAHETAHACLSMLGHWPAWLHEGIAQKLSGDILSPAQRKKMADMARQGKLPRLSNVKQDWSRMDTEHAAAAYAVALAAIEMFCEENGAYGLRNLLRNPDKLPQITADLDRRLGL